MKRSTLLAARAPRSRRRRFGPRAARAQAADPGALRAHRLGGQDEVPSAIQQFGLDKKYGLALELIDFTAPGQQYAMFRADAIDVSAGNFVDLLRQRKAGVGMRAFRGFQGYSNLIVTKPDSRDQDVQRSEREKGRRVRHDVSRLADRARRRQESAQPRPRKGCELVGGAPPLLNQFLAKGDVDATLQFSSSARTARPGPAAQLVAMPDLMKSAGFDPNCFYLQWHVAEKWTSANPGAIDRLNAMIGDAYAKLKSDDSVWPPLAAQDPRRPIRR